MENRPSPGPMSFLQDYTISEGWPELVNGEWTFSDTSISATLSKETVPRREFDASVLE